MNSKKFLGVASAALFLALANVAGAASSDKTLYHFSGHGDGENPDAGLIFDQAGNLYSTTMHGGAYGSGAVFELTPNADGSWTETVLYSFMGGQDGANPFAGLIFDQSGNLYGTAYSGGADGGVVFELTPSLDGNWTESVLHTFTGSDGWQPVGGLTFDAGGNLYGTTTHGGSFGDGTVFKLAPNLDGSWTESVLHSFTAGKDGSYPDHTSLIFDAAGNLYGATAAGGKGSCFSWTYGCGTVFELTPNSDGTWTEQVLHRFSGGNDGATPEPTLTFDRLGNLYGTTLYGNAHGVGGVFELTPNGDGSWTERLLHSFQGGTFGPWAGVIFDQAGNLYGTTYQGGNLGNCSNQGCGTIFKLTPNADGSWIETPLHWFQGKDGTNPIGSLIFDAAGDLYGVTINGGNGSGVVFEVTP